MMPVIVSPWLATDLRHPDSNPDAAMYGGCFIFHLFSLPYTKSVTINR